MSNTNPNMNANTNPNPNPSGNTVLPKPASLATRRFLRALRTSCACVLSLLAAYSLSLSYYPSAAIVTLLSLSETKRETIRTALRRLASFALSMCVAALVFTLLGHSILSLAVYVFAFVAISALASLSDMIAISAVLGINVWSSGSLSLQFVGSLALLLATGVGIALAFNLFLRGDTAGMRQAMGDIDSLVRLVLDSAAEMLGPECSRSQSPQRERFDNLALLQSRRLNELRELVGQGAMQARRLAGNVLGEDMGYFSDFIAMRQEQAVFLGRICDTISFIAESEDNDFAQWPQSVPIRELLVRISQNYTEDNDASQALALIDSMLTEYRHSALPASRDEFEARSGLFSILVFTQGFLILKSRFVKARGLGQKKDR